MGTCVKLVLTCTRVRLVAQSRSSLDGDDDEAEATRRAHTEDLARFIDWGGKVPASVDKLVSYLTAHASTHKRATLCRWVASISVAHRRAGFKNPCRHQKVRDVLKEIRRVQGDVQRTVVPALRDQIVQMVKAQSQDLAGLRNRALLLVSAGAILTHVVGVKVTHLGEDGGFLAADDADSGAGSGDQGARPSRRCNPGDREAAGLLAEHGKALLEG